MSDLEGIPDPNGVGLCEGCRKRLTSHGEAGDLEAADETVPTLSTEGRNRMRCPSGGSLYESEDELDSPSKFKGDPLNQDGESHLWTAHYEKKRFSVWSLLPPSTWLMPYVRYNLGRPTVEDKALAGGLPFSLQGDLVAGLTVGVMLVPQCLAFALLAGLPIQAGLYSSFAPLIAYAMFGTIRQVQAGPTALMSLLTGQALDGMGLVTGPERLAGASLCAVFVGGFSVLLGSIRFGFIVDFMSHSVMAAFCSAAGVTIATSQLRHMFGIKMERKKYWWQTAYHLVSHIDEANMPSVVLSFTLLFTLLFLKKWKGAGSAEKRKRHPIFRWLPSNKSGRAFKALKFVADLSSLLSVLMGWFWGLAYRRAGVEGVEYVGEVDSSGFVLALPGKNLGDKMQLDSVAISSLVMAVVGFLETMAVGGKFAMQARYSYDPNQELVALGISNIVSGLMSGYPGTGSFSRTAVNAMFGATSLIACFSASLLVALAVFFLLPVIAHLPLASLAPIIIQGAFGVISVHDFVVAWKATKAEFLVMSATFFVSLALSVKEGLLVGFILSVLKTMNDLANPNLAICGRMPDTSYRDIRNFPSAEMIPNAVVVRMDARLSFANSRKMKEFILRAVQVRENQGDEMHYVVIDGKSINHVDLTGCEMLAMLAESLKARNQGLIVANLKGPASKCLSSAGVPPVLKKHGGHLCIDMSQALAIVRGDDGMQSQKDIKELVKRVDSAACLVKNANKTNFIACRKDMCSSGMTSPSRQWSGGSGAGKSTIPSRDGSNLDLGRQISAESSEATTQVSQERSPDLGDPSLTSKEAQEANGDAATSGSSTADVKDEAEWVEASV